MLRRLAKKSSSNRLTMCKDTEVLAIMACVSKSNGAAAAEAMRVISLMALEPLLVGKLLDSCEVAIVHALSSDATAVAWQDPNSQESWALLTLVRLLRDPSATRRLETNGMMDVVKPLLGLDAETCPLAVLDMVTVATTLFLNRSEGPESEVDVASSTLAILVDAIDCVGKTIDGTLFRLGRYQLSHMLELTAALCTQDDNIRQRLLNEHFVIIRVLMHVLQNYMEGNTGNKSGGGLNDETRYTQCQCQC